MPSDDRQCLGMDGQRFSTLSRVCEGCIQGVFGALVRDTQSPSRWMLDDAFTNVEKYVAELLYPRSAGCVGGISYMCVVIIDWVTTSYDFRGVLELVDI